MAGLLSTSVGGVVAWRGYLGREAAEVAEWRTFAVMLDLEKLETGVSITESTYRGYLLTGDTTYLVRGRTAPTEARAALAHARQLAGRDSTLGARLDRLTALVEAKLAHVDTVNTRALGGDRTGAITLVQTRRGERLSRAIAQQLGQARAGADERLGALVDREIAGLRGLVYGLTLSVTGLVAALLAGLVVLRRAAGEARLALADADRERRRLAAVLDALPVGVIIADADGQFLSMTGAARRLWPGASGGALPTRVDDYAHITARRRDTGAALAPDEWPLVRALRTGEAHSCEVELRALDGAPAVVLIAAASVRSADGRAAGAVAVWTDLTERITLEERLRQASRMEAVGQLAGGVAHDFNNLLTVITGNLEFVMQDLPASHLVQPDLAQIRDAAERARVLVRQLLAFGRRQPVLLRPTPLGALVRGSERMLRRVIGEEIVLAVHAADDGLVARADPGQVEQVLVNLAVNARDAMLTARHGHPGTGGTLSIEVDRVTLAPGDSPGWDDCAPGAYVRLVVRDTGHGMDEATRARAFEPFFTTKEVGAGTGLGLSTVHGIVRQAGGAIPVRSAPGAGATFTLLLAAVDPPETPEVPADDGAGAPPPAERASGRVLLVEDEAPVRDAVRRILERQGYEVLEARHGADALLVWRERAGAVDVVVTDMRMPELGGRALAARLRAQAPELPVVFMSGYSDEAEQDVGAGGDAFLAKPFTAAELLDALGRVLSRRGVPPEPPAPAARR